MREEDIKYFESIKNDTQFVPIIENKLYKKIITQSPQGEQCPNIEGTDVIVHYVGKLMNGQVFDSSVARNEPFKFSLKTHSVIEMWDLAVPTMKQHEKALFVGVPELCYKESGAGSIPGNACLQFEIELIDWIEADREYGQTEEERLQQANIRKQLGNQLFQQQQYLRANAKYLKGVELLDTNNNLEALKLKEMLYGNSCIALQKIGNYKESYENGIKSLTIIQQIEDQTKEQQTDRKEKIAARIIKTLNLQQKYAEALSILDKYHIKQQQMSQVLEKEVNNSKAGLNKEEQKRKELMRRMMGIKNDVQYQPHVEKIMNEIQK